MLIAAGVSAAVARDMAEQAAQAQSNQAVQLANLRAEYDYIVVGAGAAGCVMAHRLSQNGQASVLVIEGGGTNLDQEKIYNPGVYTRNFGSDTDWGYKSTPQQALNNRVIVAPVGKIIGGGSSINATVWLKGDKADYDAWEAAAGPAWGYEAVIRNFKKTERFAGGAGAIRGGDGMIATRKPALAHPVTHAFVASAVGLGKAEHMDINNIASVGDAAGQQDINVDMNMRRISAAHAYLLPALSRKNLTLLAGSTVTKLDISGGNCRGVMATVDGQERRFAAAREVVVCAGGLKSPKLLMLSGIGPAEHLRQHNIPVIVDAPRIGANLHDHLLVRLVFSTKEKGAPQIDTGHSGITYMRSNASLKGPDIQVFGRQNAPNVKDLPPDMGYLTMPGLMKPKSRGTVRLASADPNAPLLVDPHYFAEQADVDAYVAGIQFAMAIGNGKGFDARAQGAGQHPERQQGADRRLCPCQRRDLLPLRRHLRHGPRGLGAGRRDAAGARHHATARRRRLRDAGDPLLQHPRADAGAGRARGGDRHGHGLGFGDDEARCNTAECALATAAFLDRDRAGRYMPRR